MVSLSTSMKKISGKLMITEQSFINFIQKLGHIPASPTICIKKINQLPLNTELQFFVNKHNLCWFADELFIKNYKFDQFSGNYKLFSTNVRDVKLSELFE